jgi:predicted PurR-regulated permease PerM
LPHPQTGTPRSASRWGIVALLVLSAALVAASLDVVSSVRSLLLAAMVLGVLVGPVVSRCLGTPSLELHDSRAERP